MDLDRLKFLLSKGGDAVNSMTQDMSFEDIVGALPIPGSAGAPMMMQGADLVTSKLADILGYQPPQAASPMPQIGSGWMGQQGPSLSQEQIAQSFPSSSPSPMGGGPDIGALIDEIVNRGDVITVRDRGGKDIISSSSDKSPQGTFSTSGKFITDYMDEEADEKERSGMRKAFAAQLLEGNPGLADEVFQRSLKQFDSVFNEQGMDPDMPDKELATFFSQNDIDPEAAEEAMPGVLGWLTNWAKENPGKALAAGTPVAIALGILTKGKVKPALGKVASKIKGKAGSIESKQAKAVSDVMSKSPMSGLADAGSAWSKLVDRDKAMSGLAKTNDAWMSANTPSTGGNELAQAIERLMSGR